MRNFFKKKLASLSKMKIILNLGKKALIRASKTGKKQFKAVGQCLEPLQGK